MERDARAFINPMFNGISTHTLTWSVTVCLYFELQGY